MYGMVNTAVKGMVLEMYGAETWARIRQAAGAPEEFVGLQAYDDAVTYGLVGAAVEVSGMPAETILHRFGRYWVEAVALAEYADLMASTGSDLITFLENIDAMHSRIKATMPELNPPSFRVKRLEGARIQVDYFSGRPGLLPFVIGMFEGLADHYGQSFSLAHVPAEANPLPSQRMILSFA